MIIEGLAYKVEKKKPVVELQEADVLCSSGLSGDLSGKPGKRQVTILSKDAWQAACTKVNADLSWLVRRSNILISGVNFSENDKGRVVQIGSLELEITGETKPCKLMEEAAQGLRHALEEDWRGGVCCRVLQDGHIKVGDQVQWRDSKNAK
ncbi:MAG: MOSC domain-containing protein [Desulfotalea sp.]